MTQPTSQEVRAPVVTRIGNLTRDPDLRYSAKGAAWGTTALAVDRRIRGEDGTWHDAPPEFYEVVCFGALAENVAECLAKGDRVLVTGRTEEDRWTGRNGSSRTTLKMVADDIGPSLRYGTVQVDRTTRRGPDLSTDRILNASTPQRLFGEDPQ